ncbi:hypothetical protein A6X21_09605 [Planctopirus hydrillae]|uniref:Uncharacterized protein n=1 Tax=Planctopirus hydrillae TaxID=1841610 RepID=A0A1C3E7Q0_9PLAN|nr:hypothetical protein A6X21_09605 [Planctopirus hydrillae]
MIFFALRESQKLRLHDGMPKTTNQQIEMKYTIHFFGKPILCVCGSTNSKFVDTNIFESESVES